MVGLNTIKIGALNIVASPHPKGIYRKLLRDVSEKEVPVGGSDKGKILAPLEFEDNPNLLFGRILIWTHLDAGGRWLNKPKNVEATEAEKARIAASLPKNFEPNYRSFNYILMEDRHYLIFETRNELSQRLSPRRAELMFGRLFDQLINEDAPEVDVTVIPEEETLNKIFAIPKLRRLEIFVKRPNADDVGDEAKRILDRLEKQGARSQKTELLKAAKKKTLEPNAQTRILAEVAAENGYVTGDGKDGTGKKVHESTAEHPKIRELNIEGSSSLAAILAALRFFR
jgi:hypothetical protein